MSCCVVACGSLVVLWWRCLWFVAPRSCVVMSCHVGWRLVLWRRVVAALRRVAACAVLFRYVVLGVVVLFCWLCPIVVPFSSVELCRVVWFGVVLPWFCGGVLMRCCVVPRCVVVSGSVWCWGMCCVSVRDFVALLCGFVRLCESFVRVRAYRVMSCLAAVCCLTAWYAVVSPSCLAFAPSCGAVYTGLLREAWHTTWHKNHGHGSERLRRELTCHTLHLATSLFDFWRHPRVSACMCGCLVFVCLVLPCRSRSVALTSSLCLFPRWSCASLVLCRCRVLFSGVLFRWFFVTSGLCSALWCWPRCFAPCSR